MDNCDNEIYRPKTKELPTQVIDIEEMIHRQYTQERTPKECLAECHRCEFQNVTIDQVDEVYKRLDDLLTWLKNHLIL